MTYAIGDCFTLTPAAVKRYDDRHVGVVFRVSFTIRGEWYGATYLGREVTPEEMMSHPGPPTATAELEKIELHCKQCYKNFYGEEYCFSRDTPPYGNVEWRDEYCPECEGQRENAQQVENARQAEFSIGKLIAGPARGLAVVLGLCIPFGLLYLLVQFVKWAWRN